MSKNKRRSDNSNNEENKNDDGSRLMRVPETPKQFSFVSSDWPSWSKRWDRYFQIARLSGLSQPDQVSHFIYTMGERAEDILDSFHLDPHDMVKYEIVREKFDEHFILRHNVTFERAKFNRRRQEAEESAENFINDLYKLAKSCKFGQLESELIRDRIVVGINDLKVSETLAMDENLTLEKAVKMVKQSEDIKKQQADLRDGNILEMRSKRASEMKRDTGTFRNRCYRCGKFSHYGKACPARDVRCYKCNGIGHFGKVCRRVNEVMEDESEPENPTKLDKIGSIAGGIGQPWTISLAINEQPLVFKIDTGADVSLISEKTFDKLEGVDLFHSKRKLVAAGGKSLNTLGYIRPVLKYKSRSFQEKIFVISEFVEPLLGRPAINGLNLISWLHPIGKVKSKKEMTKIYPQIFSSNLGKLNETYNIQIKEDAIPVSVSAPRRIPLHIREAVRNELNKMEREGVITPIKEPTDWCSPIVVAPKKNGDIRLCVDYTQLNKAVKRERFLLPTVEESLLKLRGSKFFSKLDARCGFWQVPLSETCKRLTTFITPFGRYFFNRLPFGISSGPEHFHRRISHILSSCEGVVNHLDDILVFGETKQSHDARLINVLDTLKEAGITLNEEKCVIGVDSVKFLGFKLSEQGMEIDEDKIKAIVDYPRPKNTTELRRFLGMYNYLVKFVPRMADKTKDLSCLMKKGNEFIWSEVQETSFIKLKKILTEAPVLSFFDLQKKSRISADASSYGLGGVLEQRHSDGWKPVHFISRTMTDTEKRYAQIEKEALAITWACERLSQYLIGSEFEINTDHKPLVTILGKKPISDLTVRLQRLRFRLANFNYSINYIAGCNLKVPDALSRAPLSHEDQLDSDEELAREVIEEQVNAVISQLPIEDQRLEKIKEAQDKDEVSQDIKKYITDGWPRVLHDNMQGIAPYRNELSISTTGLLLRGNRIFIPSNSRREILDRLHDGHLGIVKTLRLAKAAVWWPGMTYAIKRRVADCEHCAIHRSNRAEEMLPTEAPTLPWEQVGLDLCSFRGKTFLVVQDYFSKFIEFSKLHKTTSTEIIVELKRIFARYGVPRIIRSDNGPQFVSAEFKTFSREMCFDLRTSSPRYPRSNGQAERAVSLVKRMLVQSDPSLALLNYHAAPLESGWSPAELLMGRKLRTTVPVITENLLPEWPRQQEFRRKENLLKDRQKKGYDSRHRVKKQDDVATGTRVWVDDMKRFYRVIGKEGQPRSYTLEDEEGRRVRRNRFSFKIIPEGGFSRRPQTRGDVV